MKQQEREGYLAWAEKIVYSREDAIVGGQHRNHYCETAQLLAIVGEIKESMGERGAKENIFVEKSKILLYYVTIQQVNAFTADAVRERRYKKPERECQGNAYDT